MEIQVLLTLLENNKPEWGISFDGINPNKNNYVKCESEKDAYKLKLLIEKHFNPKLIIP
jgi:hypothetical protein